ncbi:MAG TPA: PHP domain-containing protein [Nitrospiria bacterium]|jgi:predicted metal-dependent phosphoesterase TrpH|nr:PHP domain-containing protein [Nitrospiria bacterium]
MNDRRIDLHTHSTASDGSFTPAELIRYAATKRLVALALTDHDGVDGLDEAAAEGERLGIEVIPGVELSADHPEGTMHVLGFFVDRRHEGFCGRLRRLQEARRERNPKIVQKLQGLGLQITYEEVVAASGGGQVGRPHFAKVLVQKGYVSSMQEAFERYLKKGAPGFVEKFRFSPQDVIAAIHEAGGVAVLAHPFTLYKEPSPMLEPLLGGLAESGLDGMEVIYSTYSAGQSRYYRELAEKFHLLPSGGSDFHGSHKPGIDLGVGMGRLQIPFELLEPLRKKAQGHRASNLIN